MLFQTNQISNDLVIIKFVFAKIKDFINAVFFFLIKRISKLFSFFRGNDFFHGSIAVRTVPSFLDFFS